MDESPESGPIMCDGCRGGAAWLRVCGGCSALLARCGAGAGVGGRGSWVCARCERLSCFGPSIAVAQEARPGECRPVALRDYLSAATRAPPPPSRQR